MSRFNFRDQQAYTAYAALSERPDGMPTYELDEEGDPIVAPGELYCRARLGGAGDDSDNEEGVTICPNKKKHAQSSNLRNHLKKSHDLTIRALRPGIMSVKEQHDTNRFYRKLMRRINDNALEIQARGVDDQNFDAISHTPQKMSKRRARIPMHAKTGGGAKAIAITPAGVSIGSTGLKVPRRQNGKIIGVDMRKQVGLTGRACSECIAAGRGAKECPPPKPDGICSVWASYDYSEEENSEEEDWEDWEI